jgi:citronellyl-CoA dehydrogenase
LHFDGVRVPQRYRVGAEGMGFIYQMEQFQYERLFAAIKGYAAAQKAINLTIDYTRERQAFGKSILDNQYVGYRLAEMQAETDALRALAWAGVEAVVRGEDATRIATSAKLKAGRLLREVSDGCMQFWGGMGYVHDSPISRIWRDTRLSSIGGGADEVMLQIMTKFMGTYPAKA